MGRLSQHFHQLLRYVLVTHADLQYGKAAGDQMVPAAGLVAPQVDEIMGLKADPSY